MTPYCPPKRPPSIPLSRSARELLSLREIDNRTIRLLSAHLDLSIRDTIHQIVTHYLSSHDIDLGRIFADPKSILGNEL